MSGAELIGKTVKLKYLDGDVRNEGRVVSYSDRPSVQVEYPDGTRESWLAHLVEPVPAVELPIVPTLGWLSVDSARPRLGHWQQYKSASDDNEYAIQAEVEFPLSSITAFAPATAVPTEALDVLRVAHADRTPRDHDCSSPLDGYFDARAICAFLTAIDETGTL